MTDNSRRRWFSFHMPMFESRAAPCRAVLLLGLVVAAASCETRPITSSGDQGKPTSDPVLAAARMEHAQDIAASDPARALLLCKAALADDPKSPAAQAMMDALLDSPHWAVPTQTVDFGHPVERIDPLGTDAALVSLGGEVSTTVRWELGENRISAILFPPPQPSPTTAVIVGPTAEHVLVIRGKIGLLCDAITLKPIKAIPLPPRLAPPPGLVVFSSNGLLLGHPTADAKGRIAWHIRDTTSGEVLRTVDPSPASTPSPLSAWFDSGFLHVLRADASVFDIPISPVEPTAVVAPEHSAQLIAAMMTAEGPLALVDPGSFAPPQTCMLVAGALQPCAPPSSTAVLSAHPWSGHPDVWKSFIRPAGGMLPVSPADSRVHLDGVAPFTPPSEPTAVAFIPATDTLLLGHADGTITRCALVKSTLPEQHTSEMLDDLILALTGLAAPLANAPSVVTQDLRDAAQQRCIASGSLPVCAAPRPSPPTDFLAPMLQRLADAQPASPSTVAPLTEVLQQGDPEKIQNHLSTLPENGPIAANALAWALVHGTAEDLTACLSHATHLPPLLQTLAESRLAWLTGQRGDAMAPWTEGFPDLAAIRQREDWLGWEQADFSRAFDLVRSSREQLLADYTILVDTSIDARADIVSRLLDPSAIGILGQRTLARLALDAATRLAKLPSEKENAFRLAALARRVGAPPADCLRAEAGSLTSLGQYAEAHKLWISLLTTLPATTHLPSDYAEAAYTAQENHDSRQAMIILATGLQRFPEDASYALRAGWISLLAGQSDRAYAFLLSGQRTGYPDDLLENATALLAVAARQTGDLIAADAYRANLNSINPDWEKPESIDALDWPDSIKQALHEFPEPDDFSEQLPVPDPLALPLPTR